MNDGAKDEAPKARQKPRTIEDLLQQTQETQNSPRDYYWCALRKVRSCWFRVRRPWSALAKIAVATGLGVVCAVAAVAGWSMACANAKNNMLCTAAANSPPWLLLPALAALPSALLTWYWRVQNTRQTLIGARFDHEAKRLFPDADESERALAAVQALGQLMRESPEDEHLLAQSLAAFLRRRANASGQADGFEPAARAALEILGTRRKHPEGELSLTNIQIPRMSFRGGNYRLIDFTGSWFPECDIRGADFGGSTLAGVRLEKGTHDDWTVVEGHFGRSVLLHLLGSRTTEEREAEEREAQEVLVRLQQEEAEQARRQQEAASAQDAAATQGQEDDN